MVDVLRVAGGDDRLNRGLDIGRSALARERVAEIARPDEDPADARHVEDLVDLLHALP